MELIGYLGAFFLAVCALPEVVRTVKTKKCHLGHGILCTWFIGEVLTLIYVIPTGGLPLILNYTINAIMIAIMLYYKYRYSKRG